MSIFVFGRWTPTKSSLIVSFGIAGLTFFRWANYYIEAVYILVAWYQGITLVGNLIILSFQWFWWILKCEGSNSQTLQDQHKLFSKMSSNIEIAEAIARRSRAEEIFQGRENCKSDQFKI